MDTPQCFYYRHICIINNILLTGIILFIFYPVFTHNFCYTWDDNWMVINHYTENGWNYFNLRRIFFSY